MQTTLVMTLIGPDRTGLVEAVARVVADQGGNWLESRSAGSAENSPASSASKFPRIKNPPCSMPPKRFPASA